MTADIPAIGIPRNEHGHLLCSYCGMLAELLRDSSPIYGRDYGPVWRCRLGCGWVGCHPGGCKPLGRIANRALRQAKQDAHRAFDALWRAKMEREGCRQKVARNAGYAWLAEQLGIARDLCHIGYFDIETCRRVVELCRPYLTRIRAAKEWNDEHRACG